MKNDYDFYNIVAETNTNANSKRTQSKPQTNAKQTNANHLQTRTQTERKHEQHYQRKYQDCLSHLHKCRIHGCRRYYEVSRISPIHQIWGQGLYGC